MDLKQIWDEQYDLQQLWHDWSALSGPERDSLTKELLLYLNEGGVELSRQVDQSKYHIIKRERDTATYPVADAGVKIMRILVAIMIIRGVQPDEFTRVWRDVDRRVRDKDKWERDQLASTEVLLCDLDGVVTKYADGFRTWCEAKGYDQVATLSHINTPEMEPVKDEFHRDGGFRMLMAEPRAIQVLNAWRAAKEKRRLIIVTARPYRQHRQVYGDTVDWCTQYRLAYDHIMFERDKADAVRQVAPATIIAHIEDRGKHALEVASTGVIVLKLPFAAPEEQINHPKVVHVADWDEIDNRLERLC